MIKYKITAALFYPEDDYNALMDYKFIADESNPLNERIERIKAYPFDGAEEVWKDRGVSFIEEDGDGVYLFEKMKEKM